MVHFSRGFCSVSFFSLHVFFLLSSSQSSSHCPVLAVLWTSSANSELLVLRVKLSDHRCRQRNFSWYIKKILSIVLLQSFISIFQKKLIGRVPPSSFWESQNLQGNKMTFFTPTLVKVTYENGFRKLFSSWFIRIGLMPTSLSLHRPKFELLDHW